MTDEIKISKSASEAYDTFRERSRTSHEALINQYPFEDGYLTRMLGEYPYDVLYCDNSTFEVLAPIGRQNASSIVILATGTQIDLSPYQIREVTCCLNEDGTGSFAFNYFNDCNTKPMIKVTSRRQFDAVYLALMRARIIPGHDGEIIVNNRTFMLELNDGMYLGKF